jgi:hypothetical protein
MSYGEEQQKEIATIKERKLKLKLSDSDVERLWKKAGSVNLTVSELLESFIGDLIGGTYSNGSDERDTAQQWFDRCGYGMFSNKTFLRYLIDWVFDVDGTVELWEDIKSHQEELKYAADHKDEFDEEDIEGLKEDLEYWKEQLNDTFNEFKKWAKNEATGTLEEEMEYVLTWYKEMKQMIDGDSDDIITEEKEEDMN